MGTNLSQPLSENDEWFDERLCKCDVFVYPTDEDYNWEQELSAMLRPPYCRTCGKWANRVQMCGRCSQNYYQFFCTRLWVGTPPLEDTGGNAGTASKFLSAMSSTLTRVAKFPHRPS